MRLLLTISTIFFFVLLLIVIFQNIATTMAGVWVLIYSFDGQTPAALGVIIIAGLGFITGVVATALANTILNQGEQEEPGGSNW